LAQGKPNDADLAVIQTMLEEEAAFPRLLIALRGERAGWARVAEAIERGQISASSVAGGPPSPWERLLGNPSRVRYRRWAADLIRGQNDTIDIIALPPEQWPNRLRAQQLAIGDPPPNDSILVGLLLASNEKIANAEQRALAHLRTAVTAVAAERFRIAKGNWPTKPDDLVKTGLMKAVMIDPFDGKPLRLARHQSGIAIYSVGPDLTDDGGTIDRKTNNFAKTDIGFRLFDPAARRQEAKSRPEPAKGP
jgi:hypothetical protein